jgi:hypothetical protein
MKTWTLTSNQIQSDLEFEETLKRFVFSGMTNGPQQYSCKFFQYLAYQLPKLCALIFSSQR